MYRLRVPESFIDKVGVKGNKESVIVYIMYNIASQHEGITGMPIRIPSQIAVDCKSVHFLLLQLFELLYVAANFANVACWRILNTRLCWISGCLGYGVNTSDPCVLKNYTV